METQAEPTSPTATLPSAPVAKIKPPLSVFISYKERDFRSAERIREQLAKLGGSNSLDVFVAGTTAC